MLVLTDCGKHDLLCSNDSRENSSQIYFFAVNRLKLSYEMQFTIAHSGSRHIIPYLLWVNPMIMKSGPEQ